MGGTFGHCLCTGLAVIGGRMIAQKISVRTGEVFLVISFDICWVLVISNVVSAAFYFINVQRSSQRFVV